MQIMLPGYTAWHLHQRIAELKYLAIAEHIWEVNGDKNILNWSKILSRKIFRL